MRVFIRLQNHNMTHFYCIKIAILTLLSSTEFSDCNQQIYQYAKSDMEVRSSELVTTVTFQDKAIYSALTIRKWSTLELRLWFIGVIINALWKFLCCKGSLVSGLPLWFWNLQTLLKSKYLGSQWLQTTGIYWRHSGAAILQSPIRYKRFRKTSSDTYFGI